MNLLYLALWQLLMLSVMGIKRKPGEALTLLINFPHRFSILTFKRVNRALANEFLPVWIATNKVGNEFNKRNIMKKVGRVSFLHDTCTKSSLVYYHDRNEIDGIIDVRYYIKGFRINPKANVQHLDYNSLHEMENPMHEFNTRLERSINETILNRSRREADPTFYPEMLIVMNHKTHQAIERNSKLPPGVATVSHMLTVYNAADLLYSLIPTVDIQLNIAGIVIEGMRNHWKFESAVIDDFESKRVRPRRVYVKAYTIHSKVSNYFWARQNIFPRHSYDIIQYFTISSLISGSGSIHIGQVPSPIILNTYMFPPDFFRDRLTTVVKVLPSYRHFITVAHETAHIFAVKHDGEGDLGHLFDEKSCGKSLMSTTRVCSSRCLKWSPQASQELENYFVKQQASCDLMNYPRSLDVPEPKIIFSAEWQCDCYDLESILEPNESIPEDQCGRSLSCKKESGERVEVPLPMDGTPCGMEKVCWNKECVKIKKKKRNMMRIGSK